MVRIIKEQTFQEGIKLIEAFGLSNDTKPTEGIATGSRFIEVDTVAEFLFDEESGMWLSQASGRTSIASATVTLGSSPAYDGTEKTQTVSSVKIGQSTLVADTDYVVTNNKATEVGTYILQIVGIGSYAGVISKEFSIVKATGSVTASPDTLSLTAGGDAGESTLTVVGDGAVSAEASDDCVTVAVNGSKVIVTPVEEGTATVTVTLAGSDHYTGGTDTISVTVEAAPEPEPDPDP